MRERVQGFRIALVDLMRGLALIAMTTFHFAWDLGMFGVIDPAVMFEPGPRWYARGIAGTFLFLVGFSLYLAHRKKINWRGFAMRLAQVGGAAAVISIATFFATPNAFIFFGILHSIALASVIGLIFLRLPWWVSASAGLFVLLARPWLRTPLLDDPMWWWSGLSAITPVANDYVPVFPFFGMVLLGMAAAQLSRERGWLVYLALPQLNQPVARFLRFIGRNSLVYYLLHQPVMIGLIYGFLWLTGRI
jgi:uncharacterized membrane protein